MKQVLIPLGLVLALNAQAVEIRKFDDPTKQHSYENLVKELRCLVCQNQSLADSDADLAKDLRDEVYTIIQSGKSEQDAVKFLVDRYGEFVLYKPPLKTSTTLLWLGPFVLLIGGILFLWRQAEVRNRTGQADPALSEEERQRLQQLKNKLEG